MSHMGRREEQAAYEKLRQLAAANADAQLAPAMRAYYKEARSDGLCHDGAWECTLAALGGSRKNDGI